MMDDLIKQPVLKPKEPMVLSRTVFSGQIFALTPPDNVILRERFLVPNLKIIMTLIITQILNCLIFQIEDVEEPERAHIDSSNALFFVLTKPRSCELGTAKTVFGSTIN
ncbi:uncharacterized protein LOC118647054 [Monomorium pharaonis]|uniref:uncharacterized protein LOC118647054 n=1 Tax=Monomorium pharaonis TaxID=307658 RepID=UPI001746E732|nr:uncharacterized protein LOC118647054 [Monomorium pharaonis]